MIEIHFIMALFLNFVAFGEKKLIILVFMLTLVLIFEKRAAIQRPILTANFTNTALDFNSKLYKNSLHCKRGRNMKISKVISIAMVLVGIIVFFIGLEILGIILAVVGLFFFPKSSTTSTLDSFVDDDHYYENNTKNDESDSSGSDGNDKD